MLYDITCVYVANIVITKWTQFSKPQAEGIATDECIYVIILSHYKCAAILIACGECIGKSPTNFHFINFTMVIKKVYIATCISLYCGFIS